VLPQYLPLTLPEQGMGVGDALHWSLVPGGLTWQPKVQGIEALTAPPVQVTRSEDAPV
jgi:hypothetical protein